MSKWTKEELENMLEDVVNELDLSDGIIGEHGLTGTAPAQLVRLVLERKDLEIKMLKQGMQDARYTRTPDPRVKELVEALEEWLSCADSPEEWMRCRGKAKQTLAKWQEGV
jgi:hypothetical protein